MVRFFVMYGGKRKHEIQNLGRTRLKSIVRPIGDVAIRSNISVTRRWLSLSLYFRSDEG